VQGTFIQTYAWDFNDGTPVLPNTADSVVTHTYPFAGRYLPNVVLTSPEGCPFTLRATDTVIVDSVKAAFSFGPARFCDSGYVNFVNTSTHPFFSTVQYTWQLGDGTVSNVPVPPAHLYNRPGIYPVQPNAVSRYGCRDSVRVAGAVTVNPSPSAVIEGPDLVCLGTSPSLQYQSRISSPDPVTRLVWKLNGDSIARTPDLTYDYRQPGSHILSLWVQTAAGCSFEVSRNLVIDSVNADAATDNLLFCGSGTARFINRSQLYGTPAVYDWTFGDGNRSSLTDPQHLYQSPGV